MNVAGIIVEYNPFHKGHEYHIKETRRITGADYVIAVMSGDFTERGLPACFDKFTRAECALACGADLVLELPFCYATGSAEYFSFGAVSVLDRLGCVDSLCFGSEATADASSYGKAADFFCNEPASYRQQLKALLKEGNTFPKARQEAAKAFLDEDSLLLLTSPNALLGLEYCKALMKRNSSIRPVPISRIGSGYHDTTIATEGFSSATSLRTILQEDNCFSQRFLAQLPENAGEILQEKPFAPLFPEDFLTLYRYAVNTKIDSLTSFADVSSELAGRLAKRFPPCNYESFIHHLKTKQYTRTRIERCLLHILFDLTTEELESFRSNDVSYARILGFRKEAAPLLKKIKTTATLPLITKPAYKNKLCNPQELSLLSYDFWAADCYNRVAFQKHGVLLPDDFSYIITTL